MAANVEEKTGAVFTDVAREVRVDIAHMRARQWGEWESHETAVFEQYFTSVGVEKLYKLANATHFKDQHRILDNHEYCLDQYNYEETHVWPCEIGILDMPPGNWENAVHRMFFLDADEGPREVWKLAHIEARRLTVDDSNLRLSLRQWGYVMWDRARLDEVGFLAGFWPKSERDKGIEYRKKLHHERCYEIARASDFYRYRRCVVGDYDHDYEGGEEISSDSDSHVDFFTRFVGYDSDDDDDDDDDGSAYLEGFPSAAPTETTGTTARPSVRDAATQTHSGEDASQTSD
jgi:hypothetical protein